MSFSLESLWKDATDDAIRGAVAQWSSMNEQARTVVLAEAKRRGIALEVPKSVDAGAGTSPSAAAPAAGAKVWFFVALAVAVVAVIGFLT